jgi:hypothetical protein
MKKGTEVFSIIYLLITFVIQIISYFAIYQYFSAIYKPFVLIVFALLSPVIGGIIWNYLCTKNNWSFHMGGEGNEPYGIYAFIWGIVTVFPVILCARLITSDLSFYSRLMLLKWFVSRDFILILIFSLFSGIAAISFYGLKQGSGVRFFFKSSHLEIEHREEIIITIWAAIITLTTTLSIVLFDVFSNDFIRKRVYLYFMPLILSVLFCMIFITAYYGIFAPFKLDKSHQLRGLGAGFCIRFGMFCGLLFVLNKTYFNVLITYIVYWLNSPLNK